MTYLRLIFTCFWLFSGLICFSQQSDLEKEIEKGLNLRDQDLVLSLSRKLEKSSEDKSVAHFYEAKAYLFLGNEGIIYYDSSLLCINKVLKETNNSDEIHFQASLFQAHIYLEAGKYKACVKSIQQLLRSDQVLDSPEKQFVLNVELFSLYIRISDLKSAKQLIASITQPPKNLDHFNLARSYLALGRYYLSDGKLEQAKQFFDKALHQYDDQYICYKSDAWHMLAEVSKEQKDVRQAMKIYQNLLQYEEKNNYKHGFILTLLIACETSLMNNKNQPQMAAYVEKAYQYAKKLNNKMRLVQAEMNKGFYYLQLKQNNSAIPHFEQALKISENIKAYYWTRSASRFLVDIYTNKGDYKKAFDFQKISIEANDNLQLSNQTEKADLVRNVRLMYTYRHEMEVSAYELEKKQVHLIIWIAISIGTIGISVLLFLLYLKQKRHNLFLTEKALKESERKIQIIQPIPENREEKPEPKQALDDSIYLDLQQKLVDFIDSKGFLDPECSLSSLAKEFNTNTAYLSKYINEILNTSFNQLINEYRISDFIERVKTDKEGRKTYTLDHLATLSGFNSKSTFIRAFKKQTGIAPSVFIKNLDELN